MNKHDWATDIGRLLNKDNDSHVSAVYYHKEQNAKGWTREVVAIEFTNGRLSEINVTGNSNSAILQEIIREVYGHGAYAKIER